MRRVSIGQFVLLGLLFWGVPALFVIGRRNILLVLATVLPVWWITRKPAVEPISTRRLSGTTCVILLTFTLTYLLVDALYGRKLLAWNMFLFGDAAVSTAVEQINTHVSQGRGFLELFAAFLTLLPFALTDASGRVAGIGKWALWGAAIVAIFYETATGRSYFLMAVFAIVAGRAENWRRIAWAGGVALAAFAAASMYRGDFAHVQFSNPLFDSIVFPFINLSMLLNTDCGSGHWYGFVAEFFKKFLPASIFPKTVFTFNVEMTSCIYPFFGKAPESISIFTYLGEIVYYKPSILTAFAAGTLIGVLARVVDGRLVRYGLSTARVFAGLLCVVLLRSRLQDVLSFLLSQLAFVLLWPVLCSLARLLHAICAPSDDESALPKLATLQS